MLATTVSLQGPNSPRVLFQRAMYCAGLPASAPLQVTVTPFLELVATSAQSLKSAGAGAPILHQISI
jgi:hypothetical protein